jgi:predicted dehydrogenase
MTRREAAVLSLSAVSYSRILGANNRIGLGLIGAGSRGQYVMTVFQKNAEVEVRGVCDVYGARVDAAQQKAPSAKAFYQHEKLLESKEIDAVLIASPDHWHKDHAVDSMSSGKDVYVEKPLCRTLDEGPQMVKAARQYSRICQVGIQQRSGPVYLDALAKIIRPGQLGKITHANCVWHSGAIWRPNDKERAAVAVKPSNLDWIRFLGPVRYREWAPEQYLNFRAFLDFNGGKLTDFGHHWLDVVHMFLGEDRVKNAVATGGIYHQNTEGRTAPDTVDALFEYPGFTVSFQSHAIDSGSEYGITFYGPQGRLFINRNRWDFTEARKEPVVQRFPGDCTVDHVRNFLDCVASRKLPNGDVAIADRSVVPPLLAVQSYVEGRKIHYDAASERILSR